MGIWENKGTLLFSKYLKKNLKAIVSKQVGLETSIKQTEEVIKATEGSCLCFDCYLESLIISFTVTETWFPHRNTSSVER